MNKRNQIILILLAILCTACLLSGCKDNERGNEAIPSTTVVLTVGEEEISVSEMNYYGLSFLDGLHMPEDTDMNAYYSQDYPTLNDALKAQLLTQMRQTKILYLKAIEEGITLSEEDEATVKELVDEYMKAYDAEKLERLGLSQEVLTHVYTQMQMILKLETKLAAEAGSGEVVSYGTIDNLVFLTIEVDENGNAVVDADGNYVSLSKEEQEKQKALAEEVMQKLKDGEAAEDLIEEYDLALTSGSVHGTTESLQKTYNLKDGEVSEVLSNDFGYSVVKMVALEDKDYTDRVGAYNAQTAAQEVVQSQESAWFDAFPISDEDLNEDVWNAFNFQDLQ